jgi:hypothetical protein
MNRRLQAEMPSKTAFGKKNIENGLNKKLNKKKKTVMQIVS